MIVLIPYINLLNLSWIIKCLFLRSMEPLGYLGQSLHGFTLYLAFIFHIGKGQLPRSQADRAGYENPGEDCGRPHQTVGVNR